MDCGYVGECKAVGTVGKAAKNTWEENFSIIFAKYRERVYS